MHAWTAGLSALFLGACAAGAVDTEPSTPIVVAVGEGAPTEHPGAVGPDDAPAGAARATGATSPAPTSSDVRAAAIARQLAELELATLGVLGDSGRIADLLVGSDAPGALLDAAAGSAPGVAGDDRARLGGGAGTATTGGGTLAGLSAAGSSASAGTAAPSPQDPVGVAQVGTARVRGGAVANASATVRRLRARLRRCYQEALERNGGEEGSVTVALDLGSTGEVLTARSSQTPGLSARTIACVESVGRSAQFAPPDGGSSTLEFEVRFLLAP